MILITYAGAQILLHMQLMCITNAGAIFITYAGVFYYICRFYYICGWFFITYAGGITFAGIITFAVATHGVAFNGHKRLPNI